MADILHDFQIKAPVSKVWETVTSPAGLNQWWTLTSAGEPVEGSEYELGFGPAYEWRARVTRTVQSSEFELEVVSADVDWVGTRVGVRLEERDGHTWVQFWHKGWASESDHFRSSNCCWAMYLRVMRRFLEHGETVAYEARLDV